MVAVAYIDTPLFSGNRRESGVAIKHTHIHTYLVQKLHDIGVLNHRLLRVGVRLHSRQCTPIPFDAAGNVTVTVSVIVVVTKSVNICCACRTSVSGAQSCVLAISQRNRPINQVAESSQQGGVCSSCPFHKSGMIPPRDSSNNPPLAE